MIPFSRDVFLDLVAQYNALLWPAQIAALLLGLVVLYFSIRTHDGNSRFPVLIVAVSWLAVGIGYFALHFSTLNWAAWLSAALFVTQALLLVWTGVIRSGFRLHYDNDIASQIGVALLAFAIAGYPLLGLATGTGTAALPIVGIDPGPTVLLTWGFLLLSTTPAPLVLAVIPFIAACVGAAAGWLIDLPADLVLPPAAVAGLWLILAKRRRYRGAAK
ncbi:MAG: hypothetical protein GKS00_20795 [Alphaproteobacteria bacterium]|nr:hypothetical protein [Alphaproteobacteria bacterium]